MGLLRKFDRLRKKARQMAKQNGHDLGAFREVEYQEDENGYGFFPKSPNVISIDIPYSRPTDSSIRPDLFQAVNVENNEGMYIGEVCPANINAIAKCLICDEVAVISLQDNDVFGGVLGKCTTEVSIKLHKKRVKNFINQLRRSMADNGRNSGGCI